MNPLRLLTTAEVAELCRTSTETVRYWRHLRKGPASFKLGRRVVYPAAEVERWIDEQRRSTGRGDAA